MPAPSVSSSTTDEIRKKQEQKKRDERKAKEAKAEYAKMCADPSTVEELVDAVETEREWFKEGEWRPGWGGVEFDGDGCLKNVTKAGKAKDGFFVPAGTILPLGAALQDMTVLKYGGYFPAGTSFPGGVLIPLHARMVNILPQEAKTPITAYDESLCSIQ